MKTSNEFKLEIDALEVKLAPLKQQVDDLRAASEDAEKERSGHVFSSLIEGDEASKRAMGKLEGKPQQLRSNARDIESAIRVGNEKLADLRAQLASAVVAEKIRECRSLCDQAKISDQELQKLAAPFLKAVAKIWAAENKLRIALTALGEIVKPRKSRRDFDPSLEIENRASDFGSPICFLAADILSCDALAGVEIGKRDERMMAWYGCKLDQIERELSKLQPQMKDAAA